jgi:hypothetical protein
MIISNLLFPNKKIFGLNQNSERLGDQDGLDIQVPLHLGREGRGIVRMLRMRRANRETFVRIRGAFLSHTAVILSAIVVSDDLNDLAPILFPGNP